MGFFLTDAIQSALTPAGTNARRDQEAGQQSVADQARQIAQSSGADYASVLKYLQGKRGNVESGIDALSRMGTRGGLRDQALRTGATARGQAMSQSVPLQYAGNQQLSNAYRGRAINAANGVQNQAIRQSTSPQAQSQALMQLLQALGSYQSQSYAPYAQSSSLVYGQPQVQVQPGIMDQLSPILGLLAGGKSVQRQGGAGGGVTQGASEWYSMPDGFIEDQYGNRMSQDEWQLGGY